MSLSAKFRRAPLRLVTGAYILNSGVGKFGADDDTAKKLHGFASGTYPFLGKVQPKLYAKGLGLGEIAVGTVVLLPFVSPVVAGAALVGFSGALLNVYWQTPGMHEEDSPRPTLQGSPYAKDVWMLGIGAALIADGVLEPAHDKKVEIEATVSEKRAEKGRRAKRKAAKAGAKAAKKGPNTDYLAHARDTAIALQAEAGKRARKAAKETRKAAEKAQKRAGHAADVAGHRLADVRSEYGPVAAEKAKQARGAAQDLGAKARDLADEYGPVAADKAKQARQAAQDAAQDVGARARDLADEYGPVAAEKAKQARDAAQGLGGKARERVAG